MNQFTEDQAAIMLQHQYEAMEEIASYVETEYMFQQGYSVIEDSAETAFAFAMAQYEDYSDHAIELAAIEEERDAVPF